MNDPKIKQQIAEKIRDSSNILVTVSNNPSVDELSAALGLTMLLNKLEKHATAIFSGAIPPAITFLDPEKTFESTTDSLRDFIIALDKEKADHLRYKLEGDMVRIFITPYRTTITSDDLEFSQGDFNVEMVIALGVSDQKHLDNALEAHGKILDDAAVATISAGDQTSNLGSLEWRDENASSLSEMLVALSESIRSDKSLLDTAISTAFLTGIVAATDRFSNTRTSSRVMTMAAQLMAAGADQQLIARKLTESEAIGTSSPKKKQTPKKAAEKTPEEPEAKSESDGSLSISHAKSGTVDEVATKTREEALDASTRQAERELQRQARAAESEVPAPEPDAETPTPAPEMPTPPRGAVDFQDNTPAEPVLGGTLNATTEQAEVDKRREQEKDQNKTILTHGGYLGNQPPTFETHLNGALEEQQAQRAQTVDAFNPQNQPLTARSHDVQPATPAAPLPSLSDAPAVPATPAAPAMPQVSAPAAPSPLPSLEPVAAPQTLADLDVQNRATPHEEARAAVEAALKSTPTPAAPAAPAQNDIPLPPPPPLPDFSALPPPPPPFAGENGAQPEILGDILNQSTPAPAAPATPPQSSDPAQFKIPGQQ